MIISSGPNNEKNITIPTKFKEETYRRAIAMSDKISDLTIVNINATDATEDKPANPGTVDGGFHLFDKNNDKKAGPFYTEEQFASYLNDLQK